MIAAQAQAASYYADKVASLRDIFGTPDVRVEQDRVVVGGRAYPVVEDVIVLLPRERWPAGLTGSRPAASADFAPDIQNTFGQEWQAFAEVLPAHERMFRDYFDLVPASDLVGQRVADLGCGMGRWSRFVAPHCREIVLVDFSEAIFVARRNLRAQRKALFFLGDVTNLPFRDDFADFAFSLGVLHHLPISALEAVRRLRRLAPRLLVYLYYALDNRPAHYRVLLRGVTAARTRLARIESRQARDVLSWGIAAAVYRPLVALGWLARPFGLHRHVPLHEGYRGKPMKVLQQDAYDRFFTRIEQRVTREEILGLRSDFSRVVVSDNIPYWHFLLER